MQVRWGATAGRAAGTDVSPEMVGLAETLSNHFGGASYASPILLFPTDNQGVV